MNAQFRSTLPKLGLRRKFRKMRRKLTSPRMVSSFSVPDDVFLRKIGLENVTTALNNSSVSSAIDLLLAHYQTRGNPGWPGFPDRTAYSKYDLLKLDADEVRHLEEEVLRHRFTFLNLPLVQLGERIDWFHNPTDDQMPRWGKHLNQHGWWSILANAYYQTADERFAQEFVDTMLDWVKSCPPPVYRNEMHVAWNLMGTAIRSMNWVTAFGAFFSSPTFTPAAKVTMLRSIYDHANFLALFKTNRNHLLRESLGLAHIAIFFPEFTAARKWFEIALKRFECELLVQINEDGSQIELSTGYQWAVIEDYETLRSLLQINDPALSRQHLSAWIERMYHFVVYLIRPDGNYPDLNDGFIRSKYQLLPKLVDTGRSLDRSDFVYIGTRGQSGSIPAHSSIAFENAGLYIMRSGWDKNARFLLLNAGPYGGPHGHEDKLHLEVCGFGQPFIVDSGSYTYDQDDPYRAYFVGSQGHNTVLVDGLSQVRRWQNNNFKPTNDTPCEAVWLSTPEFDFVSASYSDGYGKVILRRKQFDRSIVKFRDVCHTRQVLFVKPDYWIVVDSIKASSLHDYEVLFHAAPGIVVSKGHRNRVVFEAPSGTANLQIVPVSPAAARVACLSGVESPIQGWHSAVRSHKEPTTTAIFKYSGQASSTMTTLLYPTSSYKLGKRNNPLLEIEPVDLESGTGYAYLISTESHKDYVLISASKGVKHFGGFQSRAKIAGVRTDHSGNVLGRFKWS